MAVEILVPCTYVYRVHYTSKYEKMIWIVCCRWWWWVLWCCSQLVNGPFVVSFEDAKPQLSIYRVSDCFVTCARAHARLPNPLPPTPFHSIFSTPLLFMSHPAGYTHVARDEIDDAEASAKLALGIIDRHPAVLHLPLTFTLAEASRRLLQQPRIGRPSRRLGLCADALRVARSSLAFARPTRPAAAENVGGDVHGAGKGKIGGWCTFGDAVMAVFDKRGGGGGGGDVSTEVSKEWSFCCWCCGCAFGVLGYSGCSRECVYLCNIRSSH